jgi:hypothetical protein
MCADFSMVRNTFRQCCGSELFFSDPDPIFIRVLDPDSDPLRLVKSYGSSYGSDPKYSLVDNPNNKKSIFKVF